MEVSTEGGRMEQERERGGPETNSSSVRFTVTTGLGTERGRMCVCVCMRGPVNEYSHVFVGAAEAVYEWSGSGVNPGLLIAGPKQCARRAQ